MSNIKLFCDTFCVTPVGSAACWPNLAGIDCHAATDTMLSETSVTFPSFHSRVFARDTLATKIVTSNR